MNMIRKTMVIEYYKNGLRISLYNGQLISEWINKENYMKQKDLEDTIYRNIYNKKLNKYKIIKKKIIHVYKTIQRW